MEENNEKLIAPKPAKRRSSVVFVGVISSVVTTIVLLLVLLGVAWFLRGNIFTILAKGYYKDTQNESSLSSGNGGDSILGQESYVVDTVKKTNPAVVSIIISKNVPKYETYIPENPFGNLFPGFLFNIPQQRQNGTEKKEVGGGSGFFVTSDGLIVTNRHVVDDKDAEYTVLTNDGKKHDAKVVARDAVLDIALIKVKSENGNYPYLDLGDSDKLNVGQSVIAIGNALGEFRNTVSVGVVSGLARSITAGDGSGSSELLDHVIQTDAAINPGNSGGPLLDLRGHVIGVNVAVAQGSQSIGFALPINVVKGVIDSFKETGKIVRPYVGIRYISVTPSLKEKNNLTVDYGILVRRGEGNEDLAVMPGSPADKAGIVENDIILEIDSTKLDESNSFASIIRSKKVGDTINLKILHAGTEKEVSLVLAPAPED